MNIIPKQRLDALLEILPEREMPEKTREAAKLVFESGWSYESASRKTGVSSKRISLAARKLTAMDALCSGIVNLAT